MLQTTPKIALIIDADNISYKQVGQILEEVKPYGQLVLKLLYGDWSKPHLQNWIDCAPRYQFIRRPASSGKNATDMRIAIEMGQVLVSRPDIAVFCLVTNDGDFLPLCEVLHEYKKQVIGIGNRHAADMFIRACNRFVFLDNGEVPQPVMPVTELQMSNAYSTEAPPVSTLIAPEAPKKVAGKLTGIPIRPYAEPPPSTNIVIKPMVDFQKLLVKTLTGKKWVAISLLGQYLREVDKNFKPTNYGNLRLLDLLGTLPELVEIEEHNAITYIRLKKQLNTNVYALSEESIRELQNFLIKAFTLSDQEWLTLSTLGTNLRKDEKFKQKYGTKTLSKLLKIMPDFIQLKQESGTVWARMYPK